MVAVEDGGRSNRARRGRDGRVARLMEVCDDDHG
jgi:hypothetical protein